MHENSELTSIIHKMANSENTSTPNWTLHNEGTMGFGQLSNIERIRIEIEGSEEPLYLAYKKFYTELADNPLIESAITIHQRMISLPNSDKYVVPFMSPTKDGLIMTDLSKGEKNLVMSSNDSLGSVVSKAKKIAQSNPDFITNFVSKIDIIEETWLNEFNMKAELIAKETSEGHVKLQGDSTFFVLYPGENYELIVTDLDNTTLAESTSEEILYKHNLKKVNDLIPFIANLFLKLDS